MNALFEATGDCDAISLTDLNFGTSNIVGYEDKWITKQFQGHQSPWPGKWKSRRGVKTIVRHQDAFRNI